MSSSEEAKADTSYGVAEASTKDIENGSIRAAPEYGQGELDVGRIQQGNKYLRKLRSAEAWLDKKCKVEGMGAERVLVQDRKPPNVLYVSQLPYEMTFATLTRFPKGSVLLALHDDVSRSVDHGRPWAGVWTFRQ